MPSLNKQFSTDKSNCLGQQLYSAHPERAKKAVDSRYNRALGGLNTCRFIMFNSNHLSGLQSIGFFPSYIYTLASVYRRVGEYTLVSAYQYHTVDKYHCLCLSHGMQIIYSPEGYTPIYMHVIQINYFESPFFQERTCRHRGRTYNHGQKVVDPNPCKTCRCDNGFVACAQMMCGWPKCRFGRPIRRKGACCPVCPKRKCFHQIIKEFIKNLNNQIMMNLCIL